MLREVLNDMYNKFGRHGWKIRLIRILSIIFLMAILVAIGSYVGYSNYKVAETDHEILDLDENLKKEMLEVSNGLTDVIIEMSDEDYNNYMENGDSFTVQVMLEWNTVKDKLGDCIQTESGEPQISGYDEKIVVTVSREFENGTGIFSYTYYKEKSVPISAEIRMD